MGNSIIRFPYLGWEFNLGRSFNIGKIQIGYFGVFIGVGMLLGAALIFWIAYKTRQNIEDYMDYCIISLIAGIVGARLYYCIFNWDYYGAHPLEIITGFMEGGLAIYGAIIAALAALYVYAKTKNADFWLMADTSCIGLILGQIIGRWGNFFNREAFGGFTNSILAMQIPVTEAYGVTRDLLLNSYVYNGEAYIQVHPAFLYESLWNIGVLVIMLIVAIHKKFDGEILAVYFLGYGLGRVWIEALRTDKLLIPGTVIPVSIIVSVVLMACGAMLFTRFWLNGKKVQMVSEESKEKNDVNIVEEIISDNK